MDKLVTLCNVFVTFAVLLIALLLLACGTSASQDQQITAIAPTTTATIQPVLIVPSVLPTPRVASTRTVIASPSPSPISIAAPTSLPIVEQARFDLAGRLALPIAGIAIRKVELQASPPGYLITLEAKSKEFQYRTDSENRLIITDTPSLARSNRDFSLIWLEVQRKHESFCDVWRVFEDETGSGFWEVPCQKAGPFHFDVPPERMNVLREIALTTSSFTEQIDTPYPMTAYLYGLGKAPPSAQACSTVRDFMRWLVNPAGVGPQGQCNYKNKRYNYSVTYPCNWEVDPELDPMEERSYMPFYSPGRGRAYAPPFVKVAIDTTPPNPKGNTRTLVTLQQLEQQVFQDAKVIHQEIITLSGQPAVRAIIQSEIGGDVVQYLLVANGQDYVLTGYGDLRAAEVIMRSFHWGNEPYRDRK